MMYSLFSFLLVLQGSAAFTTPSVKLTRSSFVSKPFFVATELKSEDTPAEEATAVDADQVVSEAVDEAIAEISDEEEEDKKRVLRERYTVFLGNLPFEVTKDEIEEFCAEYGEVRQVTVPVNRESGLPRGFAFVDFGTLDQANNAINSVDGTLFKGRNVRASISDPGQKKKEPKKKVDEGVGKIYVGNLPFETTREELFEFYSGFVNTVEVYIPRNADTGTGRGFAFVTVKEEEVESAIEQTNGLEYNGRPLVVNVPLPAGQRKERRPSLSERTKLYVGNLDFSTDVEILSEVFGEFGEVMDCYMPEDPVRGGSRGFGFVTMAREEALEAVNELDGCELDGRFIRVNEAMPKGRAMSNDDNDDNDEGDDDF
mmetsp:Transcript_19806/g.41247  ORF Transcript_19806/g.41247 Transcript_19806/m.41247 type:complete len:371 (-) Transcript_19806:198-1310(-)|eukprot:CAMPEP_0172449826 /NCGR_PEP_ID=MMETSP1065-20121228/8419_1 /TAXON_ID=265537 /ORGANISM="Amphiprora paludosa, Strain CCMP125" /LENGTH=370 /DNA_ID=CAMNT_0013201571 /DNA_START=55 /DNA_END=1167 /DNA_ORIENTATION=+